MKPFRMDQMMAAVLRCLQMQQAERESSALERQIGKRDDRGGLIGDCELIRNICQLIQRVAPMPSTVLIEGESGTGKELAARDIHHLSHRSGSFVPVNCGSMTPELLESELRCLLLNTPPVQCLAETRLDIDRDKDAAEAGSLLLEAVEKRHILNVLRMKGRNKSAAARELGISRKTLERKIQAWGAV